LQRLSWRLQALLLRPLRLWLTCWQHLQQQGCSRACQRRLPVAALARPWLALLLQQLLTVAMSSCKLRRHQYFWATAATALALQIVAVQRVHPRLLPLPLLLLRLIWRVGCLVLALLPLPAASLLLTLLLLTWLHWLLEGPAGPNWWHTCCTGCRWGQAAVLWWLRSVGQHVGTTLHFKSASAV
jgi:hypothetical protein